MTTQQFFDNYAGDFAALYGTQPSLPNRLVNTLFRRSMRLRFERTLAECHPGAQRSFLDVGCGPGHYCVAIAQGGARRVVGIDFSEQMIRLAKARAAGLNLAQKCEFVTSDLFEFSPATTFSCAVVMGVMDYIEAPDLFITKVFELVEEAAFFSFPARDLLSWQRRLRYRSRCPVYFYKKAQIESLFCDYRHRIERLGRDFFVTAYA